MMGGNKLLKLPGKMQKKKLLRVSRKNIKYQ